MAPVKEPKWRVKGMENVSAPVHASLPRRQREGRSLGSQDFPRRSSAGEGGQNWFASHPSPAWPGACALAFPFSSDFPYRMHEASRVWSCALLFLRHEVVCDFCLESTHTYTRRCGVGVFWNPSLPCTVPRTWDVQRRPLLRRKWSHHGRSRKQTGIAYACGFGP